jgi:hypothetical protein
MKKARKPKRMNFHKHITRLRLLNFTLLFGLVGVLLLFLAAAAPIPGMYGSVEQDQVNRINYTRSVNGRGGLQHIECLNTVAERWTERMVAAGGISHNPNVANEVTYICGGAWSIVGENVGVGYSSEGIFNAFMNSPGHQANILDGRFTKAGLGAYWSSDGRLFITQVFANCSSCTSAWNTNATLPADPVAAPPPLNNGTTHYLRNTNTSGGHNVYFSYGDPGDIPIHCDWNGDRSETVGVFRKSTFYLSDNNINASYVFGFGNSDDMPICGDWDGNGTETVGVYRPSTATFYTRNSNSGGAASNSIRFGDPGDKPLVGDWDGNGTDTIGIHRGNTFYLKNSLAGGAADITIAFGDGGDKPLVGDWDGNGTTTIGIWRKGGWYLKNTFKGGSHDIFLGYGVSTDYPVAGDWDGNGTTTIGIVR